MKHYFLLQFVRQAVEYVILQVNTYLSINSTLPPKEAAILKGEAKEKKHGYYVFLETFLCFFSEMKHGDSISKQYVFQIKKERLKIVTVTVLQNVSIWFNSNVQENLS